MRSSKQAKKTRVFTVRRKRRERDKLKQEDGRETAAQLLPSIPPQILYIWLFFVPVWACKMCYNEDQLSGVAERKLSRHYLQHPTVSRVTAPPGCPLEQFKKDPLVPHNDRSLSPWRYVLQTDMDYYPSTYAEADCLCSGCIVFKKEKPFETYDYNSVPVVQSKLFLKKESCGNNTYHLKPVSRNVKVGCTCVRALASHS
ncbi:interleukin-17C [Scomber scombrus]|uniref:interleukin-17C n=1 Tax=Scomber scombrus TaxID=13677 RepID=UPI002DD8DFF8|nr:interleukin-17C [Scomber scombrus]